MPRTSGISAMISIITSLKPIESYDIFLRQYLILRDMLALYAKLFQHLTTK